MESGTRAPGYIQPVLFVLSLHSLSRQELPPATHTEAKASPTAWGEGRYSGTSLAIYRTLSLARVAGNVISKKAP